MRKKTTENSKMYGTPTRIRSKTVKAVNLLIKKQLTFNEKLWNLCVELANIKGVDIGQRKEE